MPLKVAALADASCSPNSLGIMIIRRAKVLNIISLRKYDIYQSLREKVTFFSGELCSAKLLPSKVAAVVKRRRSCLGLFDQVLLTPRMCSTLGATLAPRDNPR